MSRDDRHTGDPDLERDLDPDAPATPAEQGRADAFGHWVNAMMVGEPLPPAMDSDNRALLETATVVVASSRAMELGEDRTRVLVDQALEAAMVGRREDDPPSGESWPPLESTALRVASTADRTGADPGDADQAARSTTDMMPARRRADRVVRHLPWVVASIAAAAAVVLFVTRAPDRDTGRQPHKGQTAQAHRAHRPIELSVENTSRSADPLIGVIDRPESAQASGRLDMVFADRLSGYRDLMLRRELGKERP